MHWESFCCQAHDQEATFFSFLILPGYHILLARADADEEHDARDHNEDPVDRVGDAHDPLDLKRRETGKNRGMHVPVRLCWDTVRKGRSLCDDDRTVLPLVFFILDPAARKPLPTAPAAAPKLPVLFAS